MSFTTTLTQERKEIPYRMALERLKILDDCRQRVIEKLDIITLSTTTADHIYLQLYPKLEEIELRCSAEISGADILE
jgi:hypothetical protein